MALDGPSPSLPGACGDPSQGGGAHQPWGPMLHPAALLSAHLQYNRQSAGPRKVKHPLAYTQLALPEKALQVLKSLLLGSEDLMPCSSGLPRVAVSRRPLRFLEAMTFGRCQCQLTGMHDVLRCGVSRSFTQCPRFLLLFCSSPQ